MKNITLTLITLVLLTACGSTSRIEKQLTSGNYDRAITDALRKLKTNKDRKRKADYIYLLKEAFDKAEARDKERVSYLEKDNNPANHEQVYELYQTLRNRQESIKPVLPLYIGNKKVAFNFKNYNSQIIAAKDKTSNYLYNNATQLLNSNDKFDYRKAFDDFKYLDRINPNYKDVRQLIKQAHEKGTDYVIVNMINDTQQVIPRRLEDDLLNFSTYGLNDLWTVYHNNADKQKRYDFGMEVTLRGIAISPEQIKEREIIREKQVVDGWKYALDANGNVLKDSLGKKIKVDKFKTVRCEYYETRQFKSTSIAGTVTYKDYRTNQLIEAFPLQSDYLFEHFYATSRGDRRALDQSLVSYLDNRRVQFPSNEQMIYDTGEDLKLQLKEIITGNSFRR
jgi:hypothetical protein